jgi:hypothetical protein
MLSLVLVVNGFPDWPAMQLGLLGNDLAHFA